MGQALAAVADIMLEKPGKQQSENSEQLENSEQ